MNRLVAISRQEEIILAKKQEIERKKKEAEQCKAAVKQEPGSSGNSSRRMPNMSRSLAAMSRHKALLRAGLRNKSKPGSSSAPKAATSALSDCFDAPPDDKKESSSASLKRSHSSAFSSGISSQSSAGSTQSDETGRIDNTSCSTVSGSNNSTDVGTSVSTIGSSDSSSSITISSAATSSSAGGGEESAAWFQEAVARARQKAMMAAGVCPPASSGQGNMRGRMEENSQAFAAGTQPLPVPTVAAAPHSPPLQAGGVISLSVPPAIMKMVGDGQHLDAIKGVMLTRLTRYSPVIVSYAKQVFGNTDGLTDDQWKQCQEQIKMNVVFQLLQAKQVAADKLEEQGRVKYEYDSDEEDDGGTWEHKRRKKEMEVTAPKAVELTEGGASKHHIGDFLPPEEMQKFMEKFNSIREGRDPDFSDYRKNKLTSDNIGYRMLKSMGWTEGQGLGPEGQGITRPVNQNGRHQNHGLGIVAPDGLSQGDSEYDAYRKRMMLSYRFRPNPLNNPRRPYY